MSQHRLMVVEDDDQIREALAELLEDLGCQVTVASNGARALTQLQAVTSEELPCLILLDLMMPVMDGEAFREAQLADARLAAIPVVVISANRDLRPQAERMGASAFIRKPPHKDELLRAIALHC